MGLLLDSLTVPAWVRRTLEEVVLSDVAEVVLVVLDAKGPARGKGGIRELWRRRRHLLYELYVRLDRKLLPARPDAFERVSVEDLLEGCPMIRVAPERTRFSDVFPSEAVQELDSHDLDVALRFGFRILRGGVLRVARHGVWSYHHDDNRAVRGGPPGFWEVMEDHAVTGSMLQVLTERLDAGEVLYRSWSPTHRRSVNRNKNHVYWKSASFVTRKLRQLAETGSAFDDGGCGVEYAPYGARLYRKPTNRELLPHLLRFTGRAGRTWVRDAVTRDQWLWAYRLLDAGQEGPPDELFRFRAVVPPRDRSWADPFPIARGGGHFVFVEELVHRRGEDRRGHISVFEIDAAGEPSSPVPVLERPYHLSYPFVFGWRGETFMIPESASNRTVELYRCTSFPGEWTPEAVLLDGVRAVDATLHCEGDRWWMFVNIASEEATHPHDELHLFSAATPLGPWHPHRGNPVRSDARGARPAGKLFPWRGDLYRPGQDCSRLYGHSIRLHRVKRLDRDEYVEELVSTLRPGWRPGLVATHTLNQDGRLAVVDGMRRLRPWH